MSHYFIGTSGWNYAAWRGRFYPKTIPQNDWLDYYSQHFKTVEVNATFYRYFKKETFLHWHDQVPAKFNFVLKAHKVISHYKLLLNSAKYIRSFEKSAFLLKKKLGLILLQLSPRTPYDFIRLEKAIHSFAHPKQWAIEFRDEKWLTQDTWNLLKQKRVIMSSVDSPEMHAMLKPTSSIGYIRLHGHGRWYFYNYSHRELKKIAVEAKKMEDAGAKKIFIFFNNDYFAYAPKNALYLRELLE